MHHDSLISKCALGIRPSMIASVRSSPYVKESRRQRHGSRARCHQLSSLPCSYLGSCATDFSLIMTIFLSAFEVRSAMRTPTPRVCKVWVIGCSKGGKKLRAFSIFSSIHRSWPRQDCCSLGPTCCFNDDRALSGPEPNAECVSTCHSFDERQSSRVRGCVSDGKMLHPRV